MQHESKQLLSVKVGRVERQQHRWQLHLPFIVQDLELRSKVSKSVADILCVYIWAHLLFLSYNTRNNLYSFSSRLPPADQSHDAPFSSENETQGGDSAAWQYTSPPSTSPSGETPAHPPPAQPASRPRSRPASQSPSPPSALTGSKKRSSKPAHMRRNIRC